MTTTYMERVVTEKHELDAKLAKLIAFGGSDTYAELDEIDKNLLRDQRDAMVRYSETLDKRIRRFLNG